MCEAREIPVGRETVGSHAGEKWSHTESLMTLQGNLGRFWKGSKKAVLGMAVLAATGAFGGEAADAAVISWDGDTSVAWGTGGNWTGGVAPANSLTTDIANFNLATYGGNPVYAPNAGTTNIAGITIGSSNGAMSLASTNLGIGGGGITVASGAGQLTLTGPVSISAAQTWTNNSSNALVDTATSSITTANIAIKLNNALTLAGAGGFTLAEARDGNLTILAGTGTTSINYANFNNTAGVWANNSANTVTIGNTGTSGINGSNNNNTFGGSGNWLVMGNLTGSGNFTKTGLGTITLQGSASTHTGQIIVNGGQLILNANGALTGNTAVNAITVSSATLVLDNSTTVVADRLHNNRILNLGNLTLTGKSGSSITETVSSTTFGTTGTVTINNGSGGDVTTLALGTVTRSVGAAISFVGTNGTFGTGPIVTSTGVWAGVSNGILPWATVGGTSWAAANTSNSIVAYSGTFSALTTATASDNAQVSGSLSPAGATQASSLNVISTGAGQSLALGGNLNLGGGASSAAAILKSGTDAYTISGSTINAGTAGTGTELIAHVDGGALTISSNLNAAIVNLAKGGSGKLILSGTRAGTLSAVSIDGTLEFQGGTNTSLSGANLTGLGTLVARMNSGNSLTIGTAASPLAGGVVVESGNLILNVSLTNSAVTVNGGTLFFTNGNPTIKGLQGLAGTTTRANTAARILTLDTNTGTSYDYAGTLANDGTNTLSITKSGAGTQRFSGTANTYTGTTNIQEGVLEVVKLANFSANSSIGAAASGDIRIGNAGTTGTLRYTGTGDTTNRTIQIGVGSLAGDFGGAVIENNGTSGALIFSAANFNAAQTGVLSINARTLTLQGSNTSANEIQGIIRDNTAGATGTGTINLTKAGVGTWVLGGNNTYTGATNVNVGTLRINGNQSTAVGAVTVASGATLGGTGTIGGTVTATGRIAPGNSIGTLTVANNVTWNSDTSWLWELGVAGVSKASPGSSDLLDLTGTTRNFIKGTGTGFTFDFSGTGAAGWYKLVDWTGTTNFVAGDFVATNLTGGLSATFDVDTTNSALYLQLSSGAGAFRFNSTANVNIGVLVGSNITAGTATREVQNVGSAADTPGTTISGTNLTVSFSPSGTISAPSGTTNATFGATNTGSFGIDTGTADLTPAAGSNFSINYTVNVGEATAGIGTFGSNTLTGISAGTANLLSSRTTRNAAGTIDTNDILGSRADALQVDSGETLTMNWRTRTSAEIPPSGDLAPLFSDVVQITTTDPNVFVLKMYYRTDDLIGPESALFLGELVGGIWTNAGFDAQAKQGDYIAQSTIGNWGIDTDDITGLDGINYGGYVWAVVNGNGTFAVIPEPTSLALLGLGAMGLFARRRRRN